MTKVKAHTSDKYNDQADRLAKEGAHVKVINYKFFADTSLGLEQLIRCRSNVRSWSIGVTWLSSPKSSTRLINNSSLKPVEQHILEGHIDWSLQNSGYNTNRLIHPNQ
jgi:hypothetical protein